MKDIREWWYLTYKGICWFFGQFVGGILFICWIIAVCYGVSTWFFGDWFIPVMEKMLS